MKKTLLIFVVTISTTLFVNAQTTKADSIAQVEANKFVDSLTINTSIATLREWVYETVPAKKFDEFMIFYNTYLQNKYQAWIEQRKGKIKGGQ